MQKWWDYMKDLMDTHADHSPVSRSLEEVFTCLKNVTTMQVEKDKLSAYNQGLLKEHRRKVDFLVAELPGAEELIQKLIKFQVAIPSWALGTGGTRFGRFSGGGEPRSLPGGKKIEDIGLLHALNRSSGAISLHIPWDIPKDASAIKTLAVRISLRFDAMNSEYISGSAGTDIKLQIRFVTACRQLPCAVRRSTIISKLSSIGVELGSKSLTVWLSDGSCFPGQLNFRKAFLHTLKGLQEIYAALPADWKMFVE